MKGFVTTIFYTVYVNDDWDRLSDSSKLSVLIHEAKHIQQFHSSKILFPLKYLFFPFPVLWAHYRLDYEIDAYAEAIVHNHMHNNMFLWGSQFENAIKWLTGPQYFWPTLNRRLVRGKLKYMIIRKLKYMIIEKMK